ncbi:MAG: flagellar export protein FliJ [Clostridiales bacterium]|jgi:flagellar FliJ protein|nr:flagellar export protein FliJ [Eubacteriales bacterium]MDH7565001.1 flagellar export protein FliJ [Clostridiales bacterium]
MAKFEFKLQPLLNVKTQMEDGLKNELGKAIKNLEKEKSLLKCIEDEMGNCIHRINSESAHGIKVEKLREYNVFISCLKEKAEKQKDNVNITQKIVDNIRERLIKIMQEKEMLEKLKERKYSQFMQECLKEEQRVNDEVISFKYMNSLAGDRNG